MQIQFSKMHGLGNDFMVIDQISQDVRLSPELIARLSDRHTGVGFDQLLSVEPPTDPDSDFRYRIYNADGSEAEQCGNGARCFAKFVVDSGLSVKTELRLQTNSGVITTQLRDDGNVEVDMGVPSTVPEEIPFITNEAAVVHRIAVGSQELDIVAVSVGNPHAVLFVDSVNDAPVATLGPAAVATRTLSARRKRRILSGDRQRLRTVARVRTRCRRNSRLRHRCMCGCGCRRAHRTIFRAGQNLVAGRQSQNQMGRRGAVAADAWPRVSRLRRTHRRMKAEAVVVDPRNEDTVMRYLRENPDFFGRHPLLLTDLNLPHDSGEAISLVERQVAILRERNIDMRRRLTHLVGAANTNDTLFEKTRRFTLNMLDCDNLSTIDAVLADTLIDDFAADHARCFVSHPRAFESHRHLVYCSSAQEVPLLQLTQTSGLSCGLLRSDEFQALFGETAAIDGSAALIQLRHGDLVGVLAIGSRDPLRFSPEMGTLFIRYIGDVLSRVLERLLTTRRMVGHGNDNS